MGKEKERKLEMVLRKLMRLSGVRCTRDSSRRSIVTGCVKR